VVLLNSYQQGQNDVGTHGNLLDGSRKPKRAEFSAMENTVLKVVGSGIGVLERRGRNAMWEFQVVFLQIYCKTEAGL